MAAYTPYNWQGPRSRRRINAGYETSVPSQVINRPQQRPQQPTTTVPPAVIDAMDSPKANRGRYGPGGANEGYTGVSAGGFDYDKYREKVLQDRAGQAAKSAQFKLEKARRGGLTELQNKFMNDVMADPQWEKASPEDQQAEAARRYNEDSLRDRMDIARRNLGAVNAPGSEQRVPNAMNPPAAVIDQATGYRAPVVGRTNPVGTFAPQTPVQYAAQQVPGLANIVRSTNPNATPEQVRSGVARLGNSVAGQESIDLARRADTVGAIQSGQTLSGNAYSPQDRERLRAAGGNFRYASAAPPAMAIESAQTGTRDPAAMDQFRQNVGNFLSQGQLRTTEPGTTYEYPGDPGGMVAANPNGRDYWREASGGRGMQQIPEAALMQLDAEAQRAATNAQQMQDAAKLGMSVPDYIRYQSQQAQDQQGRDLMTRQAQTEMDKTGAEAELARARAAAALREPVQEPLSPLDQAKMRKIDAEIESMKQKPAGMSSTDKAEIDALAEDTGVDLKRMESFKTDLVDAEKALSAAQNTGWRTSESEKQAMNAAKKRVDDIRKSIADLDNSINDRRKRRDEILKRGSAPGGAQPSGNMANAPLITSEQQFAQLPSGAVYREEPNGPLYRKP